MKKSVRTCLVAVTCLLHLNLLFCQNTSPFQGARIILASSSDVNSNFFYVYSPRFEAKAIYSHFSEITNEYPEQLLSSILSANTQQWFDYNILESSGLRVKKETKHFEYVNKMDRNRTYMELICKLQFKFNDSDMAIIKFMFHIEEKDTVCGAYIMQKVSGKWYKTVTPFTNDLSMFLIRTKTDLIEKLLTNKPGEDKYVAEVLNKVSNEDGSISIFKLVEEFKSWYSTNDQDKIAYFKDPKSW